MCSKHLFVLPPDGGLCGKAFGNIQKPLVAAAPEAQGDIVLGFHKAAVHQNIQQAQQLICDLTAGRAGNTAGQLLPGVTRIAPDALIRVQRPEVADEGQQFPLILRLKRLTAQALQAALKKYLQHRAKGPKLHHGKQSLKQLKAHGASLTNIEVTEANIGAFKPCAKKYGVDFTLRKDKTTQPPHYIVIFKAKDADNLEQAFREFTAKTLTKEQRPSIRKVLAAAKQKAAQQPKRAKEKIKQRGLER